MQELFIYLLKSSGLIIVFFLAYHFLLRKETFFNSNRWFLLIGLVTSALLPLFFIKRIVVIEQPKIATEDLIAISKESILNAQEISTEVTTIDWFQILALGYGIIVLLLLIKVLINLFSLSKLLRNKQIKKQERYTFIDLKEDIAPFSFFNYIVFNSSLYSDSELENIVLHEKIHCKEKHSFDVLLAKLFTIIFWFNPIVWFYKKAMVQNLEYIADNKAIQLIEDKKSYQKALLKVVSHQNCLPITNHFYQSLIKKRIVMLNKNQSSKRNSWKYAVVLPALMSFVFLFQIKVVAQDKFIEIEDGATISSTIKQVTDMTWTKNSSNEEFKNDATVMAKAGIIFNFSDIKRNSAGEIITIKIAYKDKLNNQQTKIFSGNEGIAPIYFIREIDQNGKGKIGLFQKSDSNNNEINTLELVPISNIEKSKYKSIYNSHFESDSENNLDRLFIINGKQYTKEDLKGKNIGIIDAKIIKMQPSDALKKYGKRSKDGAIIFSGKADIIETIFNDVFDTEEEINTTTETAQEKNMLYIINGKEYFQSDMKGLTATCDGSITHYTGKEATEKFGPKGKDGVLVFNGITKIESDLATATSQQKKVIIFSNDNGDDIVFIPSEKSLKVPSYPSVQIGADYPVLIVNGVEKSNPLGTLNQMDLQTVKSIRVYDENGKETPRSPIKKIVITTK